MITRNSAFATAVRHVPTTVFLAVCVWTAIFGLSQSIGKPFTLDETDVARRAHMIVAEGPKGPEIWFGEGNGEAIPHPPLYDYTLALVFRIFGETETAGRGFGILCYFLVGVLMTCTLNNLLAEESAAARRAAVYLSWCLYLVNPLVIQHSMLIDADASYTFLFFSAFICLFTHFEKYPLLKKWIFSRAAMAIVFALLCLSKEGTPFLLMGGVLAYRLFCREWKKTILDFALVFVLGAAMAWSAWVVFCHFSGIDAMIFLKQQYAFRISSLGRGNFPLRVLQGIPFVWRWPVFWVSAPFFMLLIACLWGRAGEWAKGKKAESLDLCLFAGMAVWVPYFFVKPSLDMMKYQHPVYPIFILWVVICVFRTLWDKPADRFRYGSGLLCILIVTGAALCWYYYRIGDWILILNKRWGDPAWTRAVSLYAIPVVLATAALPLAVFLKKGNWKRTFVLSCAFLVFPISIALNLRQAGAYTTGESWLNYGENGLKAVTGYLSTRLSADTPCAVRKDIAYYLDRDYGTRLLKNRNITHLLHDPDLRLALLDFEKINPPHYVVIDPVVMASNPLLRSYGDRLFINYSIENKKGSFLIFRLKDELRDRHG